MRADDRPSTLLSVIDTWCAGNPGCVSPLGAREIDPLDHEELEAAGREDRPAFMFVDEAPLPPPHADIWVYGDPVVVRANGRAIPRLLRERARTYGVRRRCGSRHRREPSPWFSMATGYRFVARRREEITG